MLQINKNFILKWNKNSKKWVEITRKWKSMLQAHNRITIQKLARILRQAKFNTHLTQKLVLLSFPNMLMSKLGTSKAIHPLSKLLRLKLFRIWTMYKMNNKIHLELLRSLTSTIITKAISSTYYPTRITNYRIWGSSSSMKLPIN